MGNLPKILVVEDNPSCQQLWPDMLIDYIEMVFARTIAEAENLYAQHPDIVAITVDGSVPRNDNDVIKDGELTTTPLVHHFRDMGFRGLIVAASSSDESNSELMKAGCNAAVVKFDYTDYIRKAFGKN
ncbi:MAG: hypothetical protein HYT15_01120 [Candidatus Magasanikbacteria bacterium]|nr:hypothetical protein [Candidatus Magasanikbacteria bacterium]